MLLRSYLTNTAIIIAFCCVSVAPATAGDTDGADIPEPFLGYDNSSGYSILYDDLSELLTRVVVDTGMSKRIIVSDSPSMTGTRMKTKVKRYTEHEGNRFFFETFNGNEDAKIYLRSIQNDLEQMPTEAPLELFSRNEQLAYWLNLYNITVLNEVIAVYPERSLQSLFRGKKSILDKKLLTVSDVPLSLNDIKRILQKNYDNNPLVMYGLYQGIVGGPNIRKTAYYGDNVWLALEDNAHEFINSNRGTFRNSRGPFRVSSFYDRNREFFDDFNADLKEHLLTYIEPGIDREHLQDSSRLRANINDWTVTDLGGTDHEVGGSFSHNQAAMLDAYRGPKRIDGSILVASVIVKRKPKEKEPDEEIEKLEREGNTDAGADIEELINESNQSGE